MGMSISGLSELEGKLKRNCNLSDVKRVVSKSGERLQSRAQENAPVDTGTLKRSISLEMADGGLTAVSEAHADYSPYQEWGTRFMAAQPYMGPAFKEVKINFKSDLDKLTR